MLNLFQINMCKTLNHVQENLNTIIYNAFLP